MKYIAALDQGTTSTRFIIFNRQGEIVASAQREHKQIFPQPGWVEHDAEEIYMNTKLVVAEAMIPAGIKPSEIAAVGITNQRETTVVWNRHTGKPYHHAIVWQDMRTDKMVQELSAHYGADGLRTKTGLPFATYFSGLKLKWLLENVPGLAEDARRGDALFGTIDTWLIWKLTGAHKTDVTNASRTQLMNLHTLDWDAEILAMFDIPEAMLPKIVSSSQTYGIIDKENFSGIPITGCLGDQQAALVGQTCFETGMAKNTYGTGCFMLMNTGTEAIASKHGLLTTVGYKLGAAPVHYALEGSIAVAGSLVQWLRDNLGLIKSSGEIESSAATVPDNGDVYFVPAFSGLFTPYWRTDARGIIAGLTGFAHKGHIARAVLEATAYQTLDVLKAMEADSGIRLKALNVDGGMVLNNLLMQFQADMVRVPVQRPQVNETTALGAAYAAGLAIGYWNGLEDLRQNHKVSKVWEPEMTTSLTEKYYAGWKKAVERSMGWA
jgi:glycerol kinase